MGPPEHPGGLCPALPSMMQPRGSPHPGTTHRPGTCHRLQLGFLIFGVFFWCFFSAQHPEAAPALAGARAGREIRSIPTRGAKNAAHRRLPTSIFGNALPTLTSANVPWSHQHPQPLGMPETAKARRDRTEITEGQVGETPLRRSGCFFVPTSVGP